MSLEQQSIISKIKIPNDEKIYQIGADWKNIKNRPDLTSYAPLTSPQLNGCPTAPTAPLGTNTDQIATTAFVQQAICPTVLITVNDIPPNINVIVSATLIGSNPKYIVTEAVNSFGLASLNVDYLGEYLITFNNSQIKGSSTIKINAPKIYTYGAYWSEIVTYTILIDKINSNPETACSYADDALGMTKGSVFWDNMPIFKQIRPCVFQNGQVNYYLNPNNWSKKYASEENSILTGEDGDVMIEFPKFAYKIKTENDIIVISVSNDDNVIKNDEYFTYDAFSRLKEGDLSHFYKGAFKGSLDNEGKLRSVEKAVPVTSINLLDCRNAAQKNGAHYQQSTYAQLKALQCLFLIKYGTRDGQSTIGRGVANTEKPYISGYNVEKVNNATLENSVIARGMNFGLTDDNTVHMRIFGIEDFWGNIQEWVEGLTTDENRNIIISWNSFSGEDTAIETSTISSELTSDINGYIKEVVGNTSAGFMPINFVGGSSTTFWPDCGFLSASSALRFGGAWKQDNLVGPFFLAVNGDPSVEYAQTGARLSYV